MSDDLIARVQLLETRVTALEEKNAAKGAHQRQKQYDRYCARIKRHNDKERKLNYSDADCPMSHTYWTARPMEEWVARGAKPNDFKTRTVAA